MSRRQTLTTLACLALLAASLPACGGASSSHEHASAGIVGTTAPRPPASTSTAATTKTSSAPTGTRTASTPAETTTTGSSGVHLPATFTIGAQGGLSPPAVTAPAGVPIELTVISGNGKAHDVVLKTPHRHTLIVPAGGRASTAIASLTAGQYSLQVDGATKGTLVIGGQPGP